MKKRSHSAFTLVEMVGVLAVIAILASLLIPRVFQAIGSAQKDKTNTPPATVVTDVVTTNTTTVTNR
jgi:prepilin-type N-terminal cleavage/methylation domain-containing protein